MALGWGTASPGPPHPRAMMNFHDQHRNCHAERSEASLSTGTETLRCAQGDTPFPISFVKTHHRAATPLSRSVNLTPMGARKRHPYHETDGRPAYHSRGWDVLDESVLYSPSPGSGAYPPASRLSSLGRRIDQSGCWISLYSSAVLAMSCFS